MHARAHDDSTWLLSDLLEAFARNPAAAGFEVHYQPIVRIDDLAIVAVEALARWHHPDVGSIEPETFMGLAERTGLVGLLDDFVLDRACADADVLAQVYGRQLDIHVNISASRIGGPHLESAVARALDQHHVRPGRLVLEITETSRIAELGAAAAAVRRIRELDVGVALDDFGSGFNMLAQLHALPVDVIKLDATLIRSGSDAWRTEALCRSVLAICEQMSLTVIAEGVETMWQARLLRQMHCHLGQGYLYGPPSPLDRLARRCV